MFLTINIYNHQDSRRQKTFLNVNIKQSPDKMECIYDLILSSKAILETKEISLLQIKHCKIKLSYNTLLFHSIIYTQSNVTAAFFVGFISPSIVAPASVPLLQNPSTSSADLSLINTPNIGP